MIIGTRTAALFRKFQKQHLGIQFFWIGFPLFPTRAYYQTEKGDTFAVPLKLVDVLNVYSRYYLIPLGIWMTVIGNNRYGFEPHKDDTLYYFFMTLGYLLIGLSLYSWIFYGRSGSQEARTRRILGKVLPYNLPPQYLSPELKNRIFLILQQKFQQQFPNTNWQDLVDSGQVNKENFPLIYALATYAVQVGQGSAAQTRLERLDGMFKKK